ncbi:hypothetical protein BDB01DRAFT_147798 [Pilobolus umbonatus]|nr:hypothetical protein BDB01DRAFT_147798 [Pilobolus umbonatus]
MGGVTIAHQPMSNESKEENYSVNFPSSTPSVNEEQLNQLLSSQWSNLPMEDLTGEVQDMMMRESMNSWLDPWITENTGCVTDFDAELYAQSLQLSNLFGQGDIHFGDTNSALYDELTFDDSSLTMSAPTSSVSSPSIGSAQISPFIQDMIDVSSSDLQPQLFEDTLMTHVEHNTHDMNNQTVEENRTPVIPEMTSQPMTKRRRESTSSEGSSDSSSSGEEEDSESEQEELIIPTTVANMNSRKVTYSSSSDSESETETTRHRSRAASPVTSPYAFMHKRQIEETLLDRITNQLHPEKLPGILPIISDKSSNQQEDEVEIDLSCLPREQLVQVLSYVDACILEQNGGPQVNVEDFIVKKSKGPRTRPALIEQKPRALKKSRKPRPPRSKSRAELTEDLDGESSSSSESEEERVSSASSAGPISMASLSKKEPKRTPKPVTNKKIRRRRKVEDAPVVASMNVFQDPDSIAISRPKRRAAVHKRRLLEQMLAPSDNEEEDDEQDEGVLMLYSGEQMDLAVVDNKTIAHQPVSVPSPITQVTAVTIEENEDTDEEIDIMC